MRNGAHLRFVSQLGAVCLLALLMSAAPAVEAVMAKRGNIRFGPSVKDDIVCTLNADATIEIIGKAEGSDNWYKIKFPDQGHAWMHSMNLVQTDQERILRVTTDGTNVRRDATKGAEVVLQLKRNDTVRWQGPKVGQWYAVYVPQAVAYVHSSVIYIKDAAPASNAGTGQETTANSGQKPSITKTSSHSGHPVEVIWQDALKTYESYYQQLQQDSSKALSLNWLQLSQNLERVVKDHPDLRTRIVAKRLYNGIQRVVTSSGQAEAPVIDDGQEPIAKQTPTQHQDVVTKTDEGNNSQQTTQQDSSSASSTQKNDRPDIAMIAKTDKGIVGWLQDLEVPSIGVKFAILGDNGISAFVKVKAGAAVDLKSLHWKRVRIDGETQIVDHEVDPQYKGIPLIIIDKIDVLK